MQNDVWLHGGAGRGPKMDVASNKSKDDTKTAVKQTKHKQSMYKTRQPLFTGCNSPVCAQHGCEYDVVGTAMTSTEMGDELHRSEKKRGKHGTFEQQKAWCGCWGLQRNDCRCMQRCWFPQTLPTRQPSRCMSTVLTPD